MPESRDDGIDTRDIHHLTKTGRKAPFASSPRCTYDLLAAETKVNSRVLRLLRILRPHVWLFTHNFAVEDLSVARWADGTQSLEALWTSAASQKCMR